MGWRRGRSDLAGELELVDQLRGVGQRELLGPRDAQLAEQAVEVGPLLPGDRDDRLDLAGRRRPGRPGLPGPGPGSRAIVVADAVAARAVDDATGRSRRRPDLTLGLEPGQLVGDRLVGPD